MTTRNTTHGAGRAARRLHDDHVIRELIEEIGITIQLHEVRAWTIDVLVDLMREHAAVENERIYPWIELEARPWSDDGFAAATGTTRR